MINHIGRSTSPILQEQNGLSPAAGEVEIGEESPFTTGVLDLSGGDGVVGVSQVDDGVAITNRGGPGR